MIDVQTLLIPQIQERCKRLRSHGELRMEDISDKSTISRIENGHVPKSDNFITDTVLLDYVHTFDISPQELIFGSDTELEALLNEIFHLLFRSIKYHDLSSTKGKRYEDFQHIHKQGQKACIAMAELFAEYNLQRYNFLKTNDLMMDSLTKEFDVAVTIGTNPKIVNLARDDREYPINELTVIDCSDMEDKMWLMCKDKVIRSFQVNVIDTLFDPFSFTTINSVVDRWIIQQFCQVIAPDVVEKLKGNTLFKFGLLVKNLLQDFINEDLTEAELQFKCNTKKSL